VIAGLVILEGRQRVDRAVRVESPEHAAPPAAFPAVNAVTNVPRYADPSESLCEIRSSFAAGQRWNASSWPIRTLKPVSWMDFMLPLRSDGISS
jgi:hypothetical protein